MSINNQEECSFSKLEVVQSDILNEKFEKIYQSLNWKILDRLNF